MTRTRKRTVIVNKRRFFTAVIIAIVLLNVLAAYVCMPKHTQADAVNKTQTVIVTAGDTLWSIAEEYGGESSDIRDTMYQIKKLNNLKSSDLVVGQSLEIPTL